MSKYFSNCTFWNCAVGLLIVAACTPQPHPESNTSGNSKSDTLTNTGSQSKSDTSGTDPERKFPILNNDNAVKFLKNYLQNQPARKISVTTRLGTLKVQLYDDTPLHTANFLMLAERDYFDNTEFTRVVKDFVVQGGNNDNETEEIKRMLIGNYQLPAEMRPTHYHRRGVLAMARQYENNPEKRSSAFDFYFVHGRTFNDPQLLSIERDHDMTIPADLKKIYNTVGGAPHLDGQHTVFGEIYEGMDVLDAMASVPTDESNWPDESLIMQVEIIQE